MHENENTAGKADGAGYQSDRPSIIVRGDAGAQVARAFLDAFRPSPPLSDHEADDSEGATEG